MADHIYCGSGKERVFENGGNVLTVTLNIDEILAQYDAYGFTTNTGKRTIKVKISRRREVGQYGETHTVEIDTWKPDGVGNAYTPKQGQGSTQNASGGKTHPGSSPRPTYAPSASASGHDDGFADDIPF